MSYSADMNLELFEMDASSAVHLSNSKRKVASSAKRPQGIFASGASSPSWDFNTILVSLLVHQGLPYYFGIIHTLLHTYAQPIRDTPVEKATPGWNQYLYRVAHSRWRN